MVKIETERNVDGSTHYNIRKSCQEGVIGVSGDELRLYDGLVAERLLDLDRVQDLDRRRRRRRRAPRGNSSAARCREVSLGFPAPVASRSLDLVASGHGGVLRGCPRRGRRGPVLSLLGLRLDDPLHPSDLVPEQRRREDLPR